MLLSALRDHAQPEVLTQLLEAARRRGSAANEGSQFRRENVRAVFADIVKRATEIGAAEMRTVGAEAVPEAELGHALNRLLASLEDVFPIEKDEGENKNV